MVQQLSFKSKTIFYYWKFQ